MAKDEKGNPLYTRQWESNKSGRFFSATVTTQKLTLLLEKAKVKMPKVTLREEGTCLIYGYEAKPTLWLNRANGQFYALASEAESFGEAAVQHQAHIVLNLLKTGGFSNAILCKAVYSSSARQVLGKLRTYQSGK